MAEETEDCWLAEPINEGGDDMPKSCEILMNITEISEARKDRSDTDFAEKSTPNDKNISSKILPCHEELIREHSELQDKIKKTLAFISEKEENLKILKHGTEQEMEQFNKDKNKIEEKLKNQEARTSDLNDRICTEKTTVKALEETLQQDHQHTSMIEKEVLNFEKDMTKFDTTHTSHIDKSVSMLLRQMDGLSEMIVNYAEENIVSVSILGSHGSDRTDQEIEVILSFLEKEHQNLVGAEVKSDAFSWHDLIETALKSGNDAIWLLEEMKKRFYSVYGLFEEIVILQKSYAIDWQAEQRLITVIIPGKRQSTCRLQLHSDYPSNQSIACLHADEHLKDIISNIELQVKNNEITCLTQWLEHLHQTTFM